MTKKIPLKDFVFIRHGETDWNKENRGMGQQDIPLNQKGISQAKEAAILLKNEYFSSIAVSPLARARETAEIIAKERLAALTIIEDLKECSWGAMEGQSKGDGAWFDRWRQGESMEGAELFSDFSKRIFRGIEKALELPGPVLIVAHGGVYWALQKSFNLPVQDLKNCVPMYHRSPPSQDIPWCIYPVSGEQRAGDVRAI